MYLKEQTQPKWKKIKKVPAMHGLVVGMADVATVIFDLFFLKKKKKKKQKREKMLSYGYTWSFPDGKDAE